MVDDHDLPRSDSRNRQAAPGWTGLHSWIFLGIVALGLLVVGIQNRYHYLNPQGLGKAYRIDKLWGNIQEFEPGQGWVVAQLTAPPQSAPSMSYAPMQPISPVGQVNMPGMTLPGSVKPPTEPEPLTTAPAPKEEKPPVRAAPAEPPAAVASAPVVPPSPKEIPELSKEEKLRAFKKTFPDFGPDEFQLANDDLYPDWKKNVSPGGTWQEFLGTYRNFIEWWTDSGSPSKAGFELWKDFLAEKGGR